MLNSSHCLGLCLDLVTGKHTVYLYSHVVTLTLHLRITLKACFHAFSALEFQSDPYLAIDNIRSVWLEPDMRENKLLLGRLLPPFVTGLPLTNQQFRVGLWPISWEFLKPASSFDWPWTDGLTDGRGLLILVLCSVIFNHRVTNQRFFERRVLITRYQILCRLEL